MPFQLTCEKACVCEAGYLRNGTNGECVYLAECPNNEGTEDEKLMKENQVAPERGDNRRASEQGEKEVTLRPEQPKGVQAKPKSSEAESDLNGLQSDNKV